MPDQTAKVHTHTSNRERPKKAAASDRKVVFKSVLDNPFRIRWPQVPVNLQNIIFSHLLSLLEGASSYHEAQCRISRKRKREVNGEGPKKKTKTAVLDRDVGMDVESPLPASAPSLKEPKNPEILNHLTCGINAVTKRLEAQARQVRRNVVVASAEPEAGRQTPICLVFVCRADVDPPILIDHLPPLIAACNSVHSKHPVKIVPFPKESESILAQKLGIRRVSVMALDAHYPGLDELNSRLESVAPLAAPWLNIQAESTPLQLIPTHVKQIRTSAPKDMKAAKEARLEGRLAAQQKKRQQ